jgi:hypothetical protein
MNLAAYLLAPLALLLSPSLAPEREADAGLSKMPAAEPARPQGPYTPFPIDLRQLDVQQVRIEQQVTIRISPRAVPMPMNPQAFISDSFESDGGPRWTERKFGKCLAVAGIAGVQPGPDNRLILLLRDRRVISASLAKGCRSRDYYSGFLVARNADGQLCTARDDLLSRSGANCKVSGFKQLVQVDD